MPVPPTAAAQRRRPLHTDDPDLAAAWEELESFLDADGDTADSGRSSTSGTTGAGARHPRESLRADYATLGVAFDAPLSEVKRAYKRLMQAHHPDRFAHDPARQADATRKGGAYQFRIRAHRTGGTQRTLE